MCEDATGQEDERACRPEVVVMLRRLLRLRRSKHSRHSRHGVVRLLADDMLCHYCLVCRCGERLTFTLLDIHAYEVVQRKRRRHR